MKKLFKVKELDIYGNNELNRITYEILADIVPTLEKYKGMKLYTADGSLTAKTPIKIKTPENGQINGHYRSTSAYINKSGSSLWLNVTICLNGGDYEAKPYPTAYTQYFKKEIYLGKLNGQILDETKSLEFTTDIYNLLKILDINEINKKIEEFNNFMHQAEEKQNEIPHYLRK
jgi:hypothetical protein